MDLQQFHSLSKRTQASRKQLLWSRPSFVSSSTWTGSGVYVPCRTQEFHLQTKGPKPYDFDLSQSRSFWERTLRDIGGCDVATTAPCSFAASLTLLPSIIFSFRFCGTFDGCLLFSIKRVSRFRDRDPLMTYANWSRLSIKYLTMTAGFYSHRNL